MPFPDDTYRMGPSGADELLAPGTLLGDYEVLSLIASGGHGTVYLGQHRVLGRRAAIKVLRHDLAGSREMVARFVREAQVVNRIRHPNIVDIVDVGALPDGRPYCLMELLTGRSLAALVRARAPLAPAEAVSYLAQVCEALQAAHDAGVVHRDVKASNVLVVSEGDPPLTKLLDFGIAKVDDPGEPGFTTATHRLGSSAARAPEQIRGEGVTPRTDVYALGALLYHMLTGRLPFEAGDANEVDRLHLDAAPPRPSQTAGAPLSFDAVVARAMAKDPRNRFPSARALLDAARAAGGLARSSSVHRAAAVAIHLSLLATEADPDEALASLAGVADAAEAALRSAGFALPIATASEILGVRLLPQDPKAARSARLEAIAFAKTLLTRTEGELGEELPPGGSSEGSAVRTAIAVHAGEAEVRQTPSGPEISGGPICETASWVPAGRKSFFATAGALAGL